MHPASLQARILCLLLFLYTCYGAHAEKDGAIEIVEVIAPAVEVSAGGDIEAEMSYEAQDISALGASTLEELLEELEPDIASVRGRNAGRPIVLVNGRRIASFREIRNYPPEAVKRIEIFSEEVALRYGYRADQKVVNIQLLDEFQATALKGRASAAADGAGEALSGSSDYVRLEYDQRFSFDVQAETQQEILESDRSVPFRTQNTPFSLAGNLRAIEGGELDTALSALAGTTVTSTTLPSNAETVPLSIEAVLPFANNPVTTNTQDYRSLTPQKQMFSTSISYSHPLGDRFLATVSGSYDQSENTAYLGLPQYRLAIEADNAFSPFSNAVELNRLSQLSGPLERKQTTDSFGLSGSLAATHNGWSWSWLTNLTLTLRETNTDRRLIVDSLPADTNPFGTLESSLRLETDNQDSEVRDYDTRFLANGTLGALPHGPISAAITGAFTRNEQHNTTSNAAEIDEAPLTRNLAQIRASIDLPLMDDARAGTLSTNFNAEISHYSDFNQITVFGAGVKWRPNNALQFLLSYSAREGAPSVSELGDPILLTPNQSVYDFLNDESVRVTRISGGNADLKPEQSKGWRVGANLKPLKEHQMNFNINWVVRDTDRPINSFPSPSREIEDAFAERFRRDADGKLIEFDTRPINLFSESTSEVRWGVSYTRPIDKQPTLAGTGKKSRGQTAGRRGRNGRLLFALNHSWTLKDDLVIAPGLETLNYVGRNTNGRRGGGYEHEVTARVNYYQKGRGFNVTANWQDSTASLENSDDSVDLKFSDLYSVNLSAFYNFQPKSPLVDKFRWLKGLRIRLDVDNVFDKKRTVRDNNGNIPAGRSQDELDPYGRTLKIELRKLLR